MKGTLQEIISALPKQRFLKADGFDSAVVGEEGGALVYSKDKCVSILIDRDGMSQDEAIEFLYFNTYDAYMGEMTPIFRYDEIESLV